MNDQARLEAAVSKLAEFFDTVQVFVSKHDGEKECTYKLECGAGNILARMYQAETWLSEQNVTDEEEEEEGD